MAYASEYFISGSRFGLLAGLGLDAPAKNVPINRKTQGTFVFANIFGIVDQASWQTTLQGLLG